MKALLQRVSRASVTIDNDNEEVGRIGQGLVVFLGYQTAIGNVALGLGQYRGEFNSAWVGAMMSLIATFFIGWFGFFLVKGLFNIGYFFHFKLSVVSLFHIYCSSLGIIFVLIGNLAAARPKAVTTYSLAAPATSKRILPGVTTAT